MLSGKENCSKEGSLEGKALWRVKIKSLAKKSKYSERKRQETLCTTSYFPRCHGHAAGIFKSVLGFSTGVWDAVAIPVPGSHTATVPMPNSEWATATCAPLIGNITDYDFEDSASPRSDALLSSMKATVQRMLDGSSFEAGEAQEDMSDYTAELQNVVMPGLIFAGVIVLSLFPLWVSRCCAHKCCPHKKTTYGMQHKAAAGGCCGLWGIATVVCRHVQTRSSWQWQS